MTEIIKVKTIHHRHNKKSKALILLSSVRKPKKLVKGIMLKPTLNFLDWIMKKESDNSLIFGGPMGWEWHATLDTTHHGSLEGPVDAHRHSDLAGIGIDDHHDRDHATSHSSGEVDAVTLDASQIGTGRLSISRLPSGTDSYVLTAKGAGTDPEYEELPANPVSIGYVIDGGGSEIETGSKGYLEIPFACTITGWTILADQSGSIVVDVKKCSYGDFPTTSSIAGTEKPTLSSAQKNQNLSLTDWTTEVLEGDILEFVVDSVTSIERVKISIRGTR